MTGKRKRYSADFKAKVALEALKGELTLSQLAMKHGVHQTMIAAWRKQAIKGLAGVFSGKAEASEGDLVVIDLRPCCWHTVVALEPGSVLFETKSGLFDADRAKDLAAWAPAEGAPEAAAYLASLHAAIGRGTT